MSKGNQKEYIKVLIENILSKTTLSNFLEAQIFPSDWFLPRDPRDPPTGGNMPCITH